MVTDVKNAARRRPTEVVRGLVPWLPIPPTTPPGPPTVLEGREITSILPYDRPDSFLREVHLFADGKIAEGIHVVDPARCQGHRFGTPLLPGSVLGDLLYLTFGVLLLHSPLVSNELLVGKIGVRARDEDFRYRRRIPPGTEVTVGVELLGRRGEMHAAHGWATAEGETVFEARRCWVALIIPEGGLTQLVPNDGGPGIERNDE